MLGKWRKLDAAILPRLRDKNGKDHFWQRGGGYDENLLDSKDFEATVDYIHANPVTRNLAKKNPFDWRWSSARYYTDGTSDFGIVISPFG